MDGQTYKLTDWDELEDGLAIFERCISWSPNKFQDNIKKLRKAFGKSNLSYLHTTTHVPTLQTNLLL